MSLSAPYPYDPTARIEWLTGLDKLRAIEDRELAESLAVLWVAAGRVERRVRSERQIEIVWKETA